MTRYLRRTYSVLLAVFQTLLFTSLTHQHQASGQTATIVSARQIDDTVKVTYNIETKKKDFYNIMLRVSMDSGLTFPLQPRSLRGDVRYGVPTGNDRVINWEPLRDSIELSGTGFVFRITGSPASASIDSEFMLIKGGVFEMGDAYRGGEFDEQPLHTVMVSDFEISKFEVSNFQFSQFLRAYNSTKVKDGEFWGEPMIYEQDCGLYWNGSTWLPQPGYEYHPVVGVTWFGANEYCTWKDLRLPTEAEWEYAARCGGKKVRFGNSMDTATTQEINFNPNLKGAGTNSPRGEYRGVPTRISSYPANELDLFDMSGNVWEWCQDWYARDYYLSTSSVDPANPVNPAGPWLGQYKVIRGGSYYSPLQACRVAERSSLAPHRWKRDVGFRVVRPVRPPEPTPEDQQSSQESIQ